MKTNIIEVIVQGPFVNIIDKRMITVNVKFLQIMYNVTTSS